MAGSAQSVTDLIQRLQQAFRVDTHGNKSSEKYRYIIYTRKSTDRSEIQQNSIPEQIHRCKKLAEEHDLYYVPNEILHEERSAKISENRPIFRQMMDDIIAGRYDGIIAWAPDRLARNMKEGGEIIDLLDRGVIKDIKFANNFVFTNEPSGKMLLGIAFVMAKQYSDQHGQNVKRAVDRITNEGKCYTRPKHGYYKDAKKYLRPDGRNWEIINGAFKMRLSEPKHSLKEIAEWLRSQGYPVKTKHTNRPEQIIDIKFVSELLRDPFFAGVLVVGDHIINLSEKYDFKPIITPDEFDRIAHSVEGVGKSFRLAEAIKPQGSIQADLMRGMIFCAQCHNSMSAGLTPKKNKKGVVTKYFYYRCDTVGCKNKGKSTRAKWVIDAACDFMEHHPLRLQEGYAAYKTEMEKYVIESQKQVATQMKGLYQQRKGVEVRVQETKQALRECESDVILKKEFHNDLKIHLSKLKDIEHQISQAEQEKDDKITIIKGYDQFIELFQNLAVETRKLTKMSDIDFVMRKMFTNFEVNGNKITKITQNSPFRELCEPSKASDCVLVALTGIEPVFSD